jgi:hypothetical protein
MVNNAYGGRRRTARRATHIAALSSRRPRSAQPGRRASSAGPPPPPAGVQSSAICAQLTAAWRKGRVDAVVQSSDKNFMVPVGGALVAAPAARPQAVLDVNSSYPGRASGAGELAADGSRGAALRCVAVAAPVGPAWAGARAPAAEQRRAEPLLQRRGRCAACVRWK